MFGRSSRRLEELRLHIDSAQFRNAATQLQERLHPFQDAHVRETDLFNELKLRMFRKRWDRLRYTKHCTDDIMG